MKDPAQLRGSNRRAEVVPTQGTDPPWGGSNRMRGVFRSWGGCLDTLIITSLHLLTWSLRDLRGFDREVMSEVDRELMGLGVSRVCNDGLGRKWKI
jgi:hypothetical protein